MMSHELWLRSIRLTDDNEIRRRIKELGEAKLYTARDALVAEYPHLSD